MNNMFCYCKKAINNYHERIRRLESEIRDYESKKIENDDTLKKLKAELKFQRVALIGIFFFEFWVLIRFIIG